MPAIVRGNLRQSALEMHSGNAAAPPYAFGRALQTGVYHHGDGSLGLSSNGVSMITLTPSGVTIPKLDLANIEHVTGTGNLVLANASTFEGLTVLEQAYVQGNLRIAGNLNLESGQVAYIQSDTVVTDQLQITNDGTGPALIARQNLLEPVVEFKDDANTVFKVYDGGYVGIAPGSSEALHTNTPLSSNLLHIVGNVAADTIHANVPANMLQGYLDTELVIVGGNLSLDVPIQLPEGSASEPALSFANASSTGLYLVEESTIGITGSLLPSSNTISLGSETQRFKDIWVSSGTVYIGNTSLSETNETLIIPNLQVTNVLTVEGNATVTQTMTATAFVGDGSQLTGIKTPPSINTITITDASWTPIDDTALSTSTTGYLVIDGANFETGTNVSIGGTAAASITLVNSTLLRVSINPKTTGTYDVVVETGDGSAIKVNAVSFDPVPVWQTGTSLGNVYVGTEFSITLAASESGGSGITYSNTTALPPSTTLATNGTLSGTITETSSTTYNFSVEAIDAQLQSALRSFSLSVTLYSLYVLSAYDSTGGKVMIEGSTYTGSGSTWTNVYGTNVTLVGGVSYTDGSPAYLTFNGSRYGTMALSNPSGAYQHSVAIWFRPSSPLPSVQRIFAFGQQSSDSQSRVDIYNSSFRSSFYGSNVEWDYTMQVNQWYFIVFTYDGGSIAESRKMYLNGTSLSITNTSTPKALNVAANQTLYIATYILTDSSLYGDLAQFGFWSRALGASEVAGIWNATRAVFGR